MSKPKSNAQAPWKYEGNPHVLIMSPDNAAEFRIHIRDNDLQGSSGKSPAGSEQWFTNVRLRAIQTKAGNVQFILDFFNQIGELKAMTKEEVDRELTLWPNDQFTI